MRRVVQRFRAAALLLAGFGVAALAWAYWAGPDAYLAGTIAAGIAFGIGFIFYMVVTALGPLDLSDLTGAAGAPPRGRAARARVVALSPPRARLQRHYFVHRLELEIEDGGRRRAGTARIAVKPEARPMLAPGTEVPVRVDPADPARIALDLPAMPALAGGLALD